MSRYDHDNDRWVISAIAETLGASYWTTAAGANQSGPYVGGGTAIGTPDIVGYGSATLSEYQPETAIPTAVEIREEIDAQSTRLEAIEDYAGNASAQTTPIALRTSLFVSPDHQLTINSDGSVNTTIDLSGIPPIENNIYITVPAAVAVASQDPAVISCLRGDTLRVTLPAAGDLSARIKLVFTAKTSIHQSDEDALLQITENSGLVQINGSTDVIAADASLVVRDAMIGEVDIVVSANMTALMTIQDLVWDLQVHTSASIFSPLNGTLSVVADVTRSVE